jgi:hypothetical protein
MKLTLGSTLMGILIAGIGGLWIWIIWMLLQMIGIIT